jgi:choline dehydrogenase-like flavoprotein
MHPEDLNTARFISEKAVAWALASEAKTALPLTLTAREDPSASQHQAGTYRMGNDPASSVTDVWGTVWGHDNLHIVVGSLHVTNGGVNPVLTIVALAYRVSRRVINTLAGR